MTKPIKILTFALWGIALIMGAILIYIAVRSHGRAATASAGTAGVAWDSADKLQVLYDAPKFSLTDQDGKNFSNDDLNGKVWVADFVFTNCASLCPIMSAHMEDLQKRLPDGVKLVSFSVDPEHDTPPVLKDYAAKYHATGGRWFFLTGDPAEQMRIVHEMKESPQPIAGTDQIQHSPFFLLIDGHRHVRGIYDSSQSEQIDQLVLDARSLAGSPR